MSAPDPFSAVHRARRRRTFGLTLTGALAASALAAVVWLVPAAVASPAVTSVDTQVAVRAAETAATTPVSAASGAPPTADPAAPPSAEPTPVGGAAPTATQLAAPAAPVGQAASVDQAPPPAPGTSSVAVPLAPRDYAIAIDTAGYQTELDRCLWVRMDLTGATAPIVGAHNDCGGEVVLDLLPGDIVTLTGQNLDGRYVVVDSRDGRPGQDAGEATAGFGASVILQTCYLEGPDVRLVALVRIS